MTDKQFPLVADDELMLAPMPQMNLYDDSDFISNIMGDYVEKNYLEWQPIAGAGHAHVAESKASQNEAPVRQKTYAELAREEARADLKKKRSATYLSSDVPHKSRTGIFKSSNKSQVKPKPTAMLNQTPAGEYGKFGKNLAQDQYIVADLATYQEPVREEVQEKAQKNNYDFLKRSQIYNPQDKKREAASHAAQELNLAKFDQEKE